MVDTTQCTTCGAWISSRARVCPKCGDTAPHEEESEGLLLRWWGAFWDTVGAWGCGIPVFVVGVVTTWLSLSHPEIDLSLGGSYEPWFPYAALAVGTICMSVCAYCIVARIKDGEK